MCYNVFIIKINLFWYKRFKDGRYTVSSHLNQPLAGTPLNGGSTQYY